MGALLATSQLLSPVGMSLRVEPAVEERRPEGAAGPPGRGGRAEDGLPQVWGSPAESLGKHQLGRRSSGRGAEEGLRPPLTPPLSRTVVEVTGHAHVLLAAFEKVSAALSLTMPVTWECWAEGCCFETRSLNLGSRPWLSARRPGQVGGSPVILGSRRLGFEAASPVGVFSKGVKCVVRGHVL